MDALALGHLLAGRVPGGRLAGVRVHRGRARQRRDARSYAAHQRETDWQVGRGDGRFTAISRELRYPPEWPRRPAQEKGIDVALAVELEPRCGTSADSSPIRSLFREAETVRKYQDQLKPGFLNGITEYAPSLQEGYRSARAVVVSPLSHCISCRPNPLVAPCRPSPAPQGGPHARALRPRLRLLRLIDFCEDIIEELHAPGAGDGEEGAGASRGGAPPWPPPRPTGSASSSPSSITATTSQLRDAQRLLAATAALCGAARHAPADAQECLTGIDPELPGLLTTSDL